MLTAVAWFAALAPAAQAATTVEVRSTRSISDRGIDYSTSTVDVRGGDERSDLHVTTADDGAIIVSDTAGVSAGPGCTAQADGSARCTHPYAVNATLVDVGGGDDHVLVSAPYAQVSGGPGNDTLEGFAAATEIGYAFDGGPGDDVIRSSGSLTGGSGRDRLLGGEGYDTLNGDGGATLEPDVIDGGGGDGDWVVFSGTSTPVAVDLADPGPDGGDTVTNVERAIGGAGEDRLAGTEGANWLDGGGGDDVIIGRGGADEIIGGTGDDRLDGGAGPDRLRGEHGRDRLTGGDGADDLLPAGGRGTVDCGAGPDRVVDPGPEMFVGPECELLLIDFLELTHVRVGRTLRFSLQWDDTNVFPPCRTNLTVLRGSRTLATKSTRARDTRVHRVTVPLPHATRGPLRLVFRTAENCSRRTGGPVRGGFAVARDQLTPASASAATTRLASASSTSAIRTVRSP